MTNVFVFRLGDTEKAMYHYKLAASEADPDVVTKSKSIQMHLSKCTEAKRQRDWNTLLKESALAISAGADSAPQVNYLRIKKPYQIVLFSSVMS